MNIILIQNRDFIPHTNRVVINDKRLTHIRTVLKADTGDSLKLGLCGGNRGYGIITTIGQDEVILDVVLNEAPPSRHSFDIVLALPRPKMLRRILRTVAEFGVKNLHLINSARVEKSYWQSPLLRPEKINAALISGMERSCDTLITNVVLHQRFRPFIEDQLPALCKDRPCLLADKNATVSVTDNDALSAVVMIGPEGGFVPFEIQLATSLIAKPIHLGERTLSVDTAVTTVLAQALPTNK